LWNSPGSVYLVEELVLGVEKLEDVGLLVRSHAQGDRVDRSVPNLPPYERLSEFSSSSHERDRDRSKAAALAYITEALVQGLLDLAQLLRVLLEERAHLVDLLLAHEAYTRTRTPPSPSVAPFRSLASERASESGARTRRAIVKGIELVVLVVAHDDARARWLLLLRVVRLLLL